MALNLKLVLDIFFISSPEFCSGWELVLWKRTVGIKVELGLRNREDKKGD